jgi:hypothetical protein
MSLFTALLPKAGQPANPVYQQSLAIVWTGMGLATMLCPKLVIDLCLEPKTLPKEEGSENKSLRLAISCFGAQATVVGGILFITRFDKRAYALFGLGMLPFFVFDYLAWKYGYINTLGALGDLAGNVVFLGCSFKGAGWI